MSNIYEIIFLRQKDNGIDIKPQIAAYDAAARSIEGSLASKRFQSFYAIPQPDELPVYVLVYQWAQRATIEGVRKQLQESAALSSLLAVADIVRHTFAEQVDGDPMDVAALASGAGQVFEVVFRRIKEGQEEAYRVARKNALSGMVDNPVMLEEMLRNYELRPVMGENIEHSTVGVAVYKDQASLQKLDFMSNPLAVAFFATFDFEAARLSLAL